MSWKILMTSMIGLAAGRRLLRSHRWARRRRRRPHSRDRAAWGGSSAVVVGAEVGA